MDSIGDAGDAVFDAAAESTIGVLGIKKLKKKKRDERRLTSKK